MGNNILINALEKRDKKDTAFIDTEIENISKKHYNKIRQSIIIAIFKKFSGVNQIIFMDEEKDVVIDVALKLRSRLESLCGGIKYENF